RARVELAVLEAVRQAGPADRLVARADRARELAGEGRRLADRLVEGGLAGVEVQEVDDQLERVHQLAQLDARQRVHLEQRAAVEARVEPIRPLALGERLALLADPDLELV